MNSISYRKAVNLFLFTGLISLIILPDVVFGLIFGPAHILLELAHMIFEFIEVNLDRIVEYIFDTDVHQTQVIVFYLMLAHGFRRSLLPLEPGASCLSSIQGKSS